MCSSDLLDRGPGAAFGLTGTGSTQTDPVRLSPYGVRCFSVSEVRQSACTTIVELWPAYVTT